MKLKKWGLALALTAFGAGSVLANVGDDLAKLGARLEALQDELTEGQQARLIAYRAADNDADRMKALGIDPWSEVAERTRQLAKDAAGTEVGAEAWGMLLVNGTEAEERVETFWVLVEEYTNSPSVELVLANVEYLPEANREPVLMGLRQLAQTTTFEPTRAASNFSLANLLARDEETKKEAQALYVSLNEKYGTSEDAKLRIYAERAAGPLYESQNLQVGMQVPNFGSSDEANAAFKVSDYEGKVMLLDFWGFW